MCAALRTDDFSWLLYGCTRKVSVPLHILHAFACNLSIVSQAQKMSIVLLELVGYLTSTFSYQSPHTVVLHYWPSFALRLCRKPVTAAVTPGQGRFLAGGATTASASRAARK